MEGPEVENDGKAYCSACCCHPCRCEQQDDSRQDPETWGSEEAYEEWLFDQVFDEEEEP